MKKLTPDFHPKKTREHAQGIVEFAIIFPVLILIVLGITELGVYFMTTHTVQNASRQGARLATTLSSLGANDSRVLTYVDGIIPNSGPTAGFHGGTTNSSAGDCSTTDQLTVTVQGDYNFIALKFLGLSSVHLSFPTTMHYELCPAFPSGGTSTTIPTPSRTLTPTITQTPTRSLTPTITLTPSQTPSVSPTPTRSLTPTITLTPSRTPTASITLTPSNTPSSTFTPSRTPTFTATFSLTPTVPTNTPTRTFTPTITLTPSRTPSRTPTPSITPTPNNPDPPVWVNVTYTKNGKKCNNINLNWSANSTWSTNPGSNPTTYDRWVNGSHNSFGASTTWNSGFDLSNGQSISYDIYADFAGGIVSDPLHKAFLCTNGVLIDQ